MPCERQFKSFHPDSSSLETPRYRLDAYIITQWIKSYNKDDAIGDLLAGITVAVMLVPQGLAYAFLAGLPAVYGLYTGFMPLIIYSFMGNTKYANRHLSMMLALKL